jgi:hypothetical protein
MYAKPLASDLKSSFIEDNPDPTNIPDEFDRAGYADILVNYICGTTTTGAFNIGVFAKWGAGKSDFMLRIKSALEIKNKAGHQNIIIEFNPWTAGKTDILIDDFFETLSGKLKPYNKSIASMIREYSSLIFKPGKEIHFRILDTMINDLTADGSIKSKFDEINKGILRTGKRIVIFIDDIDRLTGAEVFQVLKIIRNTANFANTFFIVGLDEKYVVDSLGTSKSVENASQYLRKIFQLSITLPVIRRVIFPKKIKEFLGFEILDEVDKLRIERVVNHLFTNLNLNPSFENLRDVKRFCNAYKISFHMLKEEIDPLDLAILEILKLNFLAVYEVLASRKLLVYSTMTSTYSFDKERLITENLVNRSDKQLVSGIIESLIDTNNKTERRFSHQSNFYLYFSYQLFNLISLKEFNTLIKKQPTEIIDGFRKFVVEGKQMNLDTILEAFPIITSMNQLAKFSVVYLTLGSTYIELLRPLLVQQDEELVSLFDKNQGKIRKFILDLFNKGSISELNRALFVNMYVQKVNSDPNFTLFSLDFLRKTLLQLFNKYLETKPGYNSNVENFYRMIEDKGSESDQILIDPKASEVLRSYLLNDSNAFEGFVLLLLRSDTHPNIDSQFLFNPFLNQIFPDLQQFLDRLKTWKPTPQIKGLKNLALGLVQENLNSVKQKFFLERNARRLVLGHLQRLGLYSHDIKD